MLGHLKFSQDERQQYTDTLEFLDEWQYDNFDQHEQIRVWFNVPPAWVYHMRKR